jgi:hypothetical protein
VRIQEESALSQAFRAGLCHFFQNFLFACGSHRHARSSFPQSDWILW